MCSVSVFPLHHIILNNISLCLMKVKLSFFIVFPFLLFPVLGWVFFSSCGWKGTRSDLCVRIRFDLPIFTSTCANKLESREEMVFVQHEKWELQAVLWGAAMNVAMKTAAISTFWRSWEALGWHWKIPLNWWALFFSSVSTHLGPDSILLVWLVPPALAS